MIRGSTRRNLLRRTRKNVIDTHRSRFHHMRAPVTNVHLAHPARAEGGFGSGRGPPGRVPDFCEPPETVPASTRLRDLTELETPNYGQISCGTKDALP